MPTNKTQDICLINLLQSNSWVVLNLNKNLLDNHEVIMDS